MRDAVCAAKVDAGPCEAIQRRWAYNPHNNMCEEFRYGGCQGSTNRFDTKEACEARCKLVNEMKKSVKILYSLCRTMQCRHNSHRIPIALVCSASLAVVTV